MRSGLPPELYTAWEAYPWRFGEAYCIFKTFLTELVSSASVLTITAFTVERYVAICHPLRAQTMSSLRRAVNVIAVVWVVAEGASVPIWIQYGVVCLKDGLGGEVRESAVCTVRWVGGLTNWEELGYKFIVIFK